MVQAVARKILARMVRPLPPQIFETPSIASQLRLALSRAAAVVGLIVRPFSTELRVIKAGALANTLPAQWLVLPIRQSAEIVGFFALDQQVASAIRDIQMRGVVALSEPSERSFTAADCVLVLPLLEALQAELALMDPAVGVAAISDRAQIGTMPLDPNVLALALSQADVVKGDIALALGDTGREGHITFGCRQDQVRAAELDPCHTETWQSNLNENVLNAPMPLKVILGRVQMQLREVQAIGLGDVIPLTGMRISGLRVEGDGGDLVCLARLGQAAGLRAVRLEAPREHDLGPARIAVAPVDMGEGA